jgi:hypothetical protein
VDLKGYIFVSTDEEDEVEYNETTIVDQHQENKKNHKRDKENNKENSVSKEKENQPAKKDPMLEQSSRESTYFAFQDSQNYYIRVSGELLSPNEGEAILKSCKAFAQFSLNLKLPGGFQFSEGIPPCISYDLTQLNCMYTPYIQQVNLPGHNSSSKICEVLTGYEIRLVGVVHFVIGREIAPISGQSIGNQMPTVSSSMTVAINEVIDYTCTTLVDSSIKPGFKASILTIMMQTLKDQSGEYSNINGQIGFSSSNGVAE